LKGVLATCHHLQQLPPKLGVYWAALAISRKQQQWMPTCTIYSCPQSSEAYPIDKLNHSDIGAWRLGALPCLPMILSARL
jgi:hypothetical protein